MAFTDMNDVDQDLGEEKLADRNGNRSFMIIAGILGGIMVLALLCIAALALFRYLPGQRAAQIANATNEAQATAVALVGSKTAEPPAPTRTMPPAVLPPTHTPLPTHTQVIVAAPTQTPAIDVAMATVYAMRTQRALSSLTPAQPTQVEPTPAQPTSAPPIVAQATPTKSPVAPPATTAPTSRPSATALPQTGLAEELGTTGLMTAAFILVVIIFLMRRLRTAP